MFKSASGDSKGDIVLDVFIGGRRRCAWGRRWFARGRRGFFVTGFKGVAAGADKTEILKHYQQLAAFFPTLVFPLVKLQPPFHQNGLPFCEILGDDLSPASEDVDIDKCCFFPLVPVLCLESPGCGDAELADIVAVGCDPQFGIAGEISHQDDFVERGHGRYRFECSVLRMDENPLHGLIQLQVFVQSSSAVAVPGVIDLNVVIAGMFLIRYTEEILMAQVFRLGYLASGSDNLLLELVNESIDWVLVTPSVQDEGGPILFLGLRLFRHR